MRAIYPAALLLWLGVFAGEAASLARWASALERAAETAEGRYRRLDALARASEDAVREARHAADDLRLLESVPNLLPQDKGYLRTQRAVSQEVAALRRKLAPKLGQAVHIVVDAKANKLYLKKGFNLLWQADCSVGRGGTLVDKKTGRRWEFVTPRGEFRVIGKAEAPKWKKPDWAFVEAGQPVPPPDDPSRLVEGELGSHVLNLGDGYLIHGTRNEAALGRPASHGCVRLGAADLADLYAKAPVGTRVYIIY